MNISDGFTRKDAIDLAGTTSNRLQYLERANPIAPRRPEKTSRADLAGTTSNRLQYLERLNPRRGS